MTERPSSVRISGVMSLPLSRSGVNLIADVSEIGRRDRELEQESEKPVPSAGSGRNLSKNGTAR
jgi:hypothetical protein